MTSTIYSVSADCPNVIELARGLGMQTARPAIWTALQGDCCNYGASNVICDGSQRVTQIWWYTMGLYGVINGSAIPSSVMHLGLYDNVITGTFPSALPSGLRELYLHGNQMSGNLPSFPSTLQYLGLGYSGYPGNYFTGTLRLNQPIRLYINHNWITDVVIQNSSQINPSWCDLSNTPLLGNPNIAGLTMCTQDGLYSASLLPVTRSTVSTLTKTTTTSAVTTASVFGTTQLESSEITTLATTTVAKTTTKLTTTQSTSVVTTTIEPFNGATTVENPINTAFSRNTELPMSSSVLLVTGTQISALISSLETVAFAPMVLLVMVTNV